MKSIPELETFVLTEWECYDVPPVIPTISSIGEKKKPNNNVNEHDICMAFFSESCLFFFFYFVIVTEMLVEKIKNGDFEITCCYFVFNTYVDWIKSTVSKDVYTVIHEHSFGSVR